MPALRRQLLLVASPAVLFAGFSVLVGVGAMDGLDARVATLTGSLWREQLRPVWIGIALVGGSEVSVLAVAALGAWLWRQGFGHEALVILALPAAVVVELAYKHLVHHPGPGPDLSHGDAPSLTNLLGGAAGGNSFPSGHMLRTTLVFGLVAFVAIRLSGSVRTRTVVTVATACVVALMAVDRVYLGVHWLSDVIGGLLLGGVVLALATLWLDRGVPAR